MTGRSECVGTEETVQLNAARKMKGTHGRRAADLRYRQAEAFPNQPGHRGESFGCGQGPGHLGIVAQGDVARSLPNLQVGDLLQALVHRLTPSLFRAPAASVREGTRLWAGARAHRSV